MTKKSRRYILNLEEARGFRSEKIKGFLKLMEAGLPIPMPVKAIGDKSFRDYLKNDKLSEEMLFELKESFDHILKENLDRGVAIRSAFFLSTQESGLTGPRSSSIYDFNIAVSMIRRIYNFIISLKIDVEEAEICIILHPFISPSPLDESSGSAFSSYDKSGRSVLIEALYGVAEGVQSMPHDLYVVDSKDWKIEYKDIPRKTTCMKVRDERHYEIFRISYRQGKKQVLNDKTILEIARNCKKFENMEKTSELEFSFMNNRLYFIDARPFSPENKTYKDVLDKLSFDAYSTNLLENEVVGNIKVVITEEDLKEIRNSDIILIHPSIVSERKMSLIYQIANLPGKKIVLYPGQESTAHPLLCIRDGGHNIIYFTRNGEKIFKSKTIKILPLGKNKSVKIETTDSLGKVIS